jgi:hypothetical protein
VVKNRDLEFVLDALRLARRHLEDEDTRDVDDVIDVLMQAIDTLYSIEEGARMEGVVE